MEVWDHPAKTGCRLNRCGVYIDILYASLTPGVTHSCEPLPRPTEALDTAVAKARALYAA
jgi:hypothetical protein